MIVAVFGATGFIGGRAVLELVHRGHYVRAFGRNRRQLEHLTALPNVETIDLAGPWQEALEGISAVLIALGTLDPKTMQAAHTDWPEQICETAANHGCARLVHVSAIGASPDAPTAFLRTKAVGEALVLGHGRPGWTVMRPSLVYGPGGESMAFLASLAALPVRFPIRSGPVRPIAVDDLTVSIVDCLESKKPLPPILEAVGPNAMTIGDYVDGLSRWLAVGQRWKSPIALNGLMRFGRLFGQRFVNPDTAAMLARGADGDPAPLGWLTGKRFASLDEGLSRHPATKADRIAAIATPWIEALAPALGLFWIVTGVISIAAYENGLSLLASAGITGGVAIALILAGGALDVALGLMTFPRRWRIKALLLQAATILLYTAIATILVPGAWADPLGQLLKNGPIILLTLFLAHLSKADA
ncbi:MAG: SDR family oxidoreductase [Fulvimarina manganoxydans]|uniref:SDR family oxidoreductase n=1 Tax=Fulvimarina manganoxydans TaxID=937218 RepID=UPI0023579C65|nr:SDR family oxidoreductase [Fulvimarina manganoxydans]MCK5931191.1 SDR family oxidoreductase [Fulvimarina manganoxydans]